MNSSTWLRKPAKLVFSRLFCERKTKFLVFILTLTIVTSALQIPSLTAQSVAQSDQKINLTITIEPLLDKYAKPAINDDGTFYPNDKFELYYIVTLAVGVDFENVEISYDSLAFDMFDSSFGSESGWGFFEVLSSATAGVYPFYFNAFGSCFSEVENNTIPVIAETVLRVQIVEYDPHFAVELAYTIPSGSGSSYDKPFVFIVRYDGNGPNYNLNQRAIIDDYTWTGYAQKIPETDNMQQTLTPSLTVGSFLNQSSNVQFLTQGINTKINQPVLNVDGKNYLNSELPFMFLWETNTNHTYAWTKTLSVDGSGYEWFEWQASIIFPPAINLNLDPQTVTPKDLQNQLLEQINSPNGTLTTTPFGNTVTVLYAHNKDLEQIAKDAGVSKNQTITNLNPAPIYFTAQERYAKLQYQLNPKVTKEIANQNFTSNLYYNLSIGCDLFGVPRFFEANFTCEHDFFDKPINATAYKWDSNLQNWIIDNTVTIDAVFKSALNITTTDILRSNLETQTTDPVALQMAIEDLYNSGAQTFTGTGSIEAALKRTSPLYYNLQITAGQQQKTTLQKTVQINFQNNNTYHLPINFDHNAPLQITTLSDSPQNTILQIDAQKELGGLINITIYQITNLPTENWNNLQKNQLNLKLLKTLELTIPQEQVKMPTEHEQFYQYYTGYSTIMEDILGFYGRPQIPIQKDKTTIALTSSGEALLYIEATNVWGTTFHKIISVQPYSTPQWHIPLTQATIYLITIVIIAIIISFITYLIKNKQ